MPGFSSRRAKNSQITGKIGQGGGDGGAGSYNPGEAPPPNYHRGGGGDGPSSQGTMGGTMGGGASTNLQPSVRGSNNSDFGGGNYYNTGPPPPSSVHSLGGPPPPTGTADFGLAAPGPQMTPSGNFIPGREGVRSAEHPNRTENSMLGGGPPPIQQQQPLGDGYSSGGGGNANNNFGGTNSMNATNSSAEVPRFGRRAKTSEGGDNSKEERQRKYQEELRLQMEEAKRLKELKKQREKQEAHEFEQRLAKERDILKARGDYDIARESKQKEDDENAKFGLNKKGKKGGAPSAPVSSGPGDISASAWGVPVGRNTTTDPQSQQQQQYVNNNSNNHAAQQQEPPSPTEAVGNSQIQGRRGQYRVPPSDEQKKMQEEAHKRELHEQMMAVKARKEKERLEKERADKDFEAKVEAWGNAEKPGMAWGVQPNAQYNAPTKAQEGGADSSVNQNANNNNNNHLPAFLQDDGNNGGAPPPPQQLEPQHQQHQHQPASYHDQPPAFLQEDAQQGNYPQGGGGGDASNFGYGSGGGGHQSVPPPQGGGYDPYGYQQQPQFGGGAPSPSLAGGYGGGGGGGGYQQQQPPYSQQQNSSPDRARDEIMGMLLEQRRQIQDIHNQQQVVTSIATGQPLPIPGQTVALPPPAHRTYQGNYQAHHVQTITAPGQPGQQIHTTQVYVDNPDNLLQRFLKEEDRAYGGQPTSMVPASHHAVGSASPAYGAASGGSGGPLSSMESPQRGGGQHFSGGRARGEMMESAMSLGGDVEFLEGGGELTTDNAFVPLKAPKH